MHLHFRPAVLLFVSLVWAVAAEAADSAADTPGIAAQVTFLYYEDVDAAAAFYGDVLKFEKTFDEQWVRFFAITATSYVGLVDEARGYHKVSEDKPVMLSVETTDLAGWYSYLKNKNVRFVKHYDPDNENSLVNSFLLEDPGGYTVEFFQWQAKQSSDE